jgi:G:T-mismatch repair DNA endonuclease (very short patch repair protein)
MATFEKGMIPWNKGIPMQEDVKKKMIEQRKGKRVSMATEFKKGMTPWNKGRKCPQITGENHPMWGRKHSDESKRRMSETRKKLLRDNPEMVQKMKENTIRYYSTHPSPMRGKKHSDEARAKLRAARYRQGNPFKGRHHTEETKQRLRCATIEQIKSGKFANKNTSIERLMEKELLRQGIPFEKQKGLCNITSADFYVPKHFIAIYCDGDFWHKSDWAQKNGVVKKDNTQELVLGLHGYRVFRFTGQQIKKSVKQCVNIVTRYINGGGQ